jgi:microcystin degradation protein MlrC
VRRSKLAVARLWYEANSFNPLTVPLAAFRAHEWVRGEAADRLYAGTATEMGAVVEFAHSQTQWETHFLRCAAAPPGGLVVQADLDAIHDEIIEGLDAMAWDAVYLSLHGASLSVGDVAPDYTLLRRVRETVGPDVPVAVSFDMHACLNPAISELVQVLTGYRTYPHVDMYETAQRALALLMRCVQGGVHTRVRLHPVPMLPVSHLMRTDSGPMAELLSIAAREEGAEGIHDVSIFGGFAYADSPHAHMSVSVCHEENKEVSGVCERLFDAVMDQRDAFRTVLPGPRVAMAEALDLVHKGVKWPIALLESADNPLSGGLGDTTGLFEALVDADLDLPSVFCFFHDPGLVERAHACGEGAMLSTMLGGRIEPAFGAPVPFEARVVLLTDGRFINSGPMQRSMPVNLGRTAVLQRGLLKVVITESCQSANDPAWCELHGIDLAHTGLFCVKAKNHFRASFGDLCGAIIDVDTPGPAPVDLRLLPYTHVPRHFLIAQELP